MAEHVLIAGATGFVGSSLAEALARAGYSVLAMTGTPTPMTASASRSSVT